MALGTIADHLSPQAGLVEGREQSSQEEDLWGAGELGCRHTPPPSPHTPAPAWGICPPVCRGTRLLPEDGGAGVGVPSHTEHT